MRLTPTAMRAAVLAALFVAAAALTTGTATAGEGFAVLYRDGITRPHLCSTGERRAAGVSTGASCVVQPIPDRESWACSTTLPPDSGPWPARGRIVPCD